MKLKAASNYVTLCCDIPSDNPLVQNKYIIDTMDKVKAIRAANKKIKCIEIIISMIINKERRERSIKLCF